jgi:hypothetical protein
MPNPTRTVHTTSKSDAGFTLGEALISVVLTLVVISGAIETLTRALSLTGTSRVMSETNHGLQAAMSLMVRDVMQTGQGIPLGGIPLPNGAGALEVFRPGPTGGMTFGAGTSTDGPHTRGRRWLDHPRSADRHHHGDVRRSHAEPQRPAARRDCGRRVDDDGQCGTPITGSMASRPVI